MNPPQEAPPVQCGMTRDPENPAPPVDPWARTRADYLAGMSAPVLAERYGLSERTIRRRAAEEGWRRSDGPSSLRRMPISRDEAVEMYPELESVDAAAAEDRLELLLQPQPQRFRRYAFLQAAEAAAVGQPLQATLWMRLVRQLDQSHDAFDCAPPPFSQADYMRAGFLHHRLETERGAAPSADDGDDVQEPAR